MRTTPSKFKGHNDRGAILLMSVLVLVFLSILMGAAMQRVMVQIKEVDSRRVLQEAFYAAEAGVDHAVNELRIDSRWKPGESGYAEVVNRPLEITTGTATRQIGFYTLTVVNAEDYRGWETRMITSIGRDAQQRVSRTIQARVIVESPSRFLISTLGTQRIVSGARLDGDILADELYFDVNSAITNDDKRKIIIDGDALYLQKAVFNGNPTLTSHPDVQYDSLEKAPNITFPGVDILRYEELARTSSASHEGYHTNGALHVNLGSLDSLPGVRVSPFRPKIIFARGDIHITGGSYDSSVLVVSTGNIYIETNVYPPVNRDAPSAPQIGLFAAQDVIIPDNAGQDMDIQAFIMAGRNLKAEGTTGTRGELKFTGAMSVRGDTTNAINLSAFLERQYEHNPYLIENRSIPYSPFIVNIIQWQEI